MKKVAMMLLGVFAASFGGSAWAVTRYVNLNSPSPTPPYTSWETAATVIQDAINISAAGDVVLVTNGAYAVGGGARTNFPDQLFRVFITNAIHITSVNGPHVTSIVGAFDPITGGPGSNAVRCVYVTGRGQISGFTLTNGATGTIPLEQGINVRSGGGLYLHGGVASNLIIRNCRAASYGGGVILDSAAGNPTNYFSYSLVIHNTAISQGGGVFFNSASLMRNCVIANNTVSGLGTVGGGVMVGISGTIESCTIAGNVASPGGTSDSHGLRIGGGSTAKVINSIIYGNTTNVLSQYSVPADAISWSCTTPLPAGVGNIDTDPRFLETELYRIHPLSPCVDAGTNQAWMLVAGALDVEGEPRLRNGQADIGADEAWQFQALSIARQPGALEITWDTTSAGTFEVQGSMHLPDPSWTDTGVIVTNLVPYATTTLLNASADYEAYRLRRLAP
ncbi:MAG TPA: hypothetical protein PKE26_10270 [Kiritimatiellia bacterium]|nr:hypothetical protein [Kiritimatiellia bacterium]HMO99483.1 hypothetical protein [Kiritimatiellia bacterium]HMP97527.1 hypothetical protein [Kiritimatiellia bacterium]